MEALVIVFLLLLAGYAVIRCIGAEKKVNDLKRKVSANEETLKQQKDELSLKESDLQKAMSEISLIRPKAEKYDQINHYEVELQRLIIEFAAAEKSYSEISKKLDPYKEYLELADYGHFRAIYDFEDIEKYADALKLVIDAQKVMIKNSSVFVMEVLDLEGTDIIKNLKKITLTAFNCECDAVVRLVNYNNFDSCKDKIIDLHEKINKLLDPFRMSISNDYLNLKIQELTLGFEYEQEKQKIKDEQAELLAQMKEEEEARAEAEQAREDAIEKEAKYVQALEEARKEIEGKTNIEKEDMLNQIKELQAKLEEAKAERERATSMAQITKAGHVYIISNIGSFGENIFKIGMTRRKDPLDRVKELGDASVPFFFDIHGMIYADDAPTLENALHRHFDTSRVNKVNLKKEFFSVSIDQIADVCEKLGFKVKLSKLAEAREYRESFNKGL